MMLILRMRILLLLPALLSGCSTMPWGSGSKPPAPTIERAPSAESATIPKHGGYYLDDGPGGNPPPDINAIPDAVPRNESPLPRANRPYVAFGESYTPATEYQPYQASGIASWYGKRYHGQKTSSGEIYDMYGMTAAHATLPIPSYVRVTNPENGRSVIVRINDRGPFHQDRLIDLSYAAAYKLNISGKGSAPVTVEAIDTRNLAAALPGSETPSLRLAEQDKAQKKAVLTAPLQNGSFIQVGAFKLRENADQLRDHLLQQKLAQDVGVESWYNDNLYRVRLGPYASRDDAERTALQIRQSLGISAFVLTQ
jgi:rare lipoprotein A